VGSDIEVSVPTRLGPKIHEAVRLLKDAAKPPERVPDSWGWVPRTAHRPLGLDRRTCRELSGSCRHLPRRPNGAAIRCPSHET
jgi:hypothetical protein